MNKFLIFIFPFFHYFGFSQESLEPLKTNFKIINDHSLKKNNSNNNQEMDIITTTISKYLVVMVCQN